MYKKFFFIGLGGSGGKTLRFLKRDLRRWMDENGASDQKMPAAWQFLHIDTPTLVDGEGVAEGVPWLEDDEYLGLVEKGIGYNQVQAILDGDDGALHEEIMTWRVDPAGLAIGIDKGASQFRAVGRTIATAFMGQMKTRIEKSVDRINNANSTAELSNLYRSITGQDPRQDGEIIFVIISSLAGGTGAGLLFPVSDILRAFEPNAGGRSIGLLYTPEVFETLGKNKTGGVQANSLAAISELMNGLWWGGGTELSVDDQVIVEPKSLGSLKKAGLPFTIDRSGPAYNFLIGRTGVGGVTFGPPQELFEMVGRTLVSWMVDPVVSSKLSESIIGNWSNASKTHKQLDVLVYEPGGTAPVHEIGYPGFSGLGFARVGIGSEYFRVYAGQRIARDALEIAVRSHISNPEAMRIASELNTIVPEETSNEWAKRQLHDFLQQCKLSEMGPDENQIQDAFTPPTINAMQENLRFLAAEKAQSFVPNKPTGKDWVSAIEQGLDQALQDYVRDFKVAFNSRIEEWVTGEGPRQVLRVVENFITRCGLLTTASLVRQTAAHLRSQAVTELRNVDLVDYQRWAGLWRDEVASNLSGQQSKRLGSDDPAVQKAIDDGVRYAKYQANVYMIDVVTELIEDFSDGFLKPLAEALQNGFEVASKALEDSRSWPEWNDSLPSRALRPPTSEFTIIDPEDYSKFFIDLLELSYSEADQNRAREITRNDVLSSDFVRVEVERNKNRKSELDHLLTINIEKEWWPRASLVADGIKSRSVANIEIRVSSEQVLQRADAWLTKPNSPFAEVIDADLGAFLGQKDAYGQLTISAKELTRRRNKFLSQFKEAINAAQPLVNIDRRMWSLVHPETPLDGINDRAISQIPLASHDLQEELSQMLKSLGVDDSLVKDLFVTPQKGSKKKFIDISTFLWPPISALPIESLVNPIAADWTRAAQGRANKEFWMFRRSTTLQEFIPAPQAIIIGMIRGWYVANLMGLVKRRQQGSDPIKISLEKGGVVEFPTPYLTFSSDRDDDICLILEALSVAYVQCSVNGNLVPLNPYRELRNLGQNREGGYFEYREPGNRFTEFIRTGVSPKMIEEPLVTGDSPESRAKEIATLLAAHKADLSAKYEQSMNERRLQPSRLSGPPLFTGLWGPMNKVLSDLEQAMQGFAFSPATGRPKL